MIGQALLVVAFLMVIGALATWKTRDRVVRMAWVAPLWFGAACAVVIALTAVVYLQRLRDFDQCVQRTERSLGNHEQTLQLYDTIDAATGTSKYTAEPILPGLPSLRTSLDINLPVLTVGNCTHP